MAAIPFGSSIVGTTTQLTGRMRPLLLEQYGLIFPLSMVLLANRVEVYRTTSVLRKLGKEPGLESVTMSITVFRNFLREALFRLSKRIEIWESSGKMNWKVKKHVRNPQIKGDRGGST
jgi:hypothetical protein